MKTERMTEDQVKRKVVYYIRVEQPSVANNGDLQYNKVPKTTVTLLEDNEGNFARGVAMCSSLDIFNKKLGRAVSLNRALAAFDAKKNIGPINRYDVTVEEEMVYKIEYKPELTEYEKKLLKGPKDV